MLPDFPLTAEQEGVLVYMLGADSFKRNYPVIRNHPWLMPLAPVIRIVLSLREHPGRIRGEIRALLGK